VDRAAPGSGAHRRAYQDALEALADAHWHSSGVPLQHALWALAGAMATVVAMRWLA
jgi:hypothetical protein